MKISIFGRNSDWGFFDVFGPPFGEGFFVRAPLCVTPPVRGVPEKKSGKYEGARRNGVGDRAADRWVVWMAGGGERVSASREKFFEVNNFGF